ncbi:GIY-YIG nuclease family protein [Deinococcus aetherius]|nr:GIY-YIG nuclease family protein [Deinococcus aetherius]
MLPLDNFYLLRGVNRRVSACRSCTRRKLKENYDALPKEEHQARNRKAYERRKQKQGLSLDAPDGLLHIAVTRDEVKTAALKAIGHVPFRISGVYAIRNLKTGQVYVGSAHDVRSRWGTHFWRLNQGNHHSPRLQRAWNRDGAECFQFDLLEAISDRSILILVEQAWIDFLHAFAVHGGYNVSATAGSTAGRPSSEKQKQVARQRALASARPYRVTWPDGRTETVPNLRVFCEQQGLHQSAMRKLAAGKQTAPHRGFRCARVSDVSG